MTEIYLHIVARTGECPTYMSLKLPDSTKGLPGCASSPLLLLLLRLLRLTRAPQPVLPRLSHIIGSLSVKPPQMTCTLIKFVSHIIGKLSVKPPQNYPVTTDWLADAVLVGEE